MAITKYQQQEVSGIVQDALLVTPSNYHYQLKELFKYLAEQYALSRNKANLDDIQSMVTAAQEGNSQLINEMTKTLRTEIVQLRNETHKAFELVGNHIGEHDRRLTALENKEHIQPSVTVINTDNSRGGEGLNKTQFVFWVLTAIAILGCMLTLQSVNVQRTYQIQREEVR